MLDCLQQQKLNFNRITHLHLIVNYILLWDYFYILNSELKKVTCEWITKQGKDSIEIHFGEKMKKLKEIAEIASYAIEETEKLQQKFIDIEVEYLNTINSKLHQSTTV